ncbi:hypothetical protein RchiOBHm_Chr1g0375481 [Rosa chinensis]|uniref:Uncharacterized protein n=1 Tax=Rosa chinensis TaxID=74649 RepID=A0A2P6SMP0_ROSCH|nr:hypothetical protein RchiOBHm_Chr1g0375481 [Rosa chinensis]
MKVDLNSLSPSPFSFTGTMVSDPSAVGTNDRQTIRARYSISYDLINSSGCRRRLDLKK